MGYGGFYGDELGDLVAEVGVFGDAAADGGVLLAEGGFEFVAGGGDGGGPVDGGTVGFEQGLIVDTACGKAATGGEEVLFGHRREVAVTVAGAGIIGFGSACRISDLFHDGEQVDPLGAFNVGGTDAFGGESLGFAGQQLESIDDATQSRAFGFKHTADRNDVGVIQDPLTAAGRTQCICDCYRS